MEGEDISALDLGEEGMDGEDTSASSGDEGDISALGLEDEDMEGGDISE